jgi:hypothetical protein
MFQAVINREPALAVEGDFASTNPRASIPPVIGGAFKVAPGQTVRVGYFAFANVLTGLVYSSLAGAGGAANAIVGFVARQPNEPSAMITAFLGESVMVLQDGREVTLFRSGDFYVQLPGADPGEGIFALATTGAPSLVDDATTENTGWVAGSTAKVNAVSDANTTIAANTGIMTLSAPASGVYEVGQRVTGVGVPAYTYIERQLTGAAGVAGTYQTNSRNRAAVAAFTATMIQGGLAKIVK